MQRYTLLTLASCPTLAGSPHLPISPSPHTPDIVNLEDTDEYDEYRGAGNDLPRPDYFPS